jgi:hypothetical protein
MLTLRNLEEKDYETLLEYWKFWRFPAPTRGMLPKDLSYSFAVIYEGNILSAGFLYVTPSEIAWLEFIISNPKIKDKEIRSNALYLLIDTICQVAKNMGFKSMFTSVKNENLIKKYADCGFIKGSTSIEMIKIL